MVQGERICLLVELIYKMVTKPSYQKQGVGVRRVGWSGGGGSKELLVHLLLFLDLWQPLCVSEKLTLPPVMYLGY